MEEGQAPGNTGNHEHTLCCVVRPSALSLQPSLSSPGRYALRFRQPFAVAQQFTGREGRYVPLRETVRGFREILDGKHDDISEGAFMMVGSIDEAVEQAARMAAG